MKVIIKKKSRALSIVIQTKLTSQLLINTLLDNKQAIEYQITMVYIERDV